MKLVLCTALAIVLAPVSLRAAELELDKPAPAFEATGVDGQTYSLKSTGEAKALVVVFTCNACPVAKAYEQRFKEFTEDYTEKKVTFLAINCNNKSEDLAKMKAYAEKQEFNFPYAFDETGAAARDFGARVTPHVFVFDGDRKLIYRGAFDDSMSKPTEPYVRDAVDAILAGETPKTRSTRAVGCGIKLKFQ